MKYGKLRVIISGGGTGGHIFPALSIADKLKELNPETEILFVGAAGRMEMEKVPAAGYRIEGLPMAGLQRKLTLSNLALPFKVLKSISMAKRLVREFKPDIAIGVGGYASAPLLWAAGRLGVPTLIQEQNGYAGLTNKIVGKKAKSICVAYDGMERFFPADRIVFSGNPIRKEIVPATEEMRKEAMEFYGLDTQKKHIFIVGGSLGSGTLNNAMKKWISDGCPGGDGIEIIWQCGKFYKPSVDAFMKEAEAAVLGGAVLKQKNVGWAVDQVAVIVIAALDVVDFADLTVFDPQIPETFLGEQSVVLVKTDGRQGQADGENHAARQYEGEHHLCKLRDFRMVVQHFGKIELFILFHQTQDRLLK